MSDQNLARLSRAHPRRLYVRLMVLVTLILASAAVIENNNSVRSAPLYLFLLAFGVAITMALGRLQGGLVALLLVSAWITVKQVTGVWSGDRLLFNLLELVTVALTFIAAGAYHENLQTFLTAHAEAQNQLKKLDLEDMTIGLIKAPVGVLRLNEEEERSVRYKRPFSLVLILMRPIPNVPLASKDSIGIMRALAATVKDTTRDVDIPFLAASNKIALILPETETNGANKVVNNILKQMLAVKFINQAGIAVLIKDYVQIRFGFATFLGKSDSEINMLEAAESSLQKSIETNTGDVFQNLFIEWTMLGEQHTSTVFIGGDIQKPADPQESADAGESPAEANQSEPDRLKKTLERLASRLRSL